MALKTLTVRNISDDTYARLRDLAKQNHRSLQEQARYLLEIEVNLRQSAVMEDIAEYRTKLTGRALGDSVQELREDRSR